jgi:hypothetical protein
MALRTRYPEIIRLSGNYEDCLLISVVLNAYKRTEYLESQIEALLNQTVKPKQIYVWQNAGSKVSANLKEKVTFVECNKNLGVWARFAFALNVDTPYVCLFDDDTIPGKKWFENCLDTLSKTEGLLGTRGVRFLSKNRYFPFISFGWDSPNESIEQVDIVGHAWFFKREWLTVFWRELPPIGFTKLAGEDMHFSYTLQKYLNLNTYVPPHPKGDPEMWGSRPETANFLGSSPVAISSDLSSLNKFDTALKFYTKNGFKLFLSSGERLKHGLVIGGAFRSSVRIRTFFSKHPRIKNFLKILINFLRKIKIYI